MDDHGLAIREASLFTKAGGKTFVDVTIDGTGYPQIADMIRAKYDNAEEILQTVLVTNPANYSDNP